MVASVKITTDRRYDTRLAPIWKRPEPQQYQQQQELQHYQSPSYLGEHSPSDTTIAAPNPPTNAHCAAQRRVRHQNQHQQAQFISHNLVRGASGSGATTKVYLVKVFAGSNNLVSYTAIKTNHNPISALDECVDSNSSNNSEVYDNYSCNSYNLANQAASKMMPPSRSIKRRDMERSKLSNDTVVQQSTLTPTSTSTTTQPMKRHDSCNLNNTWCQSTPTTPTSTITLPQPSALRHNLSASSTTTTTGDHNNNRCCCCCRLFATTDNVSSFSTMRLTVVVALILALSALRAQGAAVLPTKRDNGQAPPQQVTSASKPDDIKHQKHQQRAYQMLHADGPMHEQHRLAEMKKRIEVALLKHQQQQQGLAATGQSDPSSSESDETIVLVLADRLFPASAPQSLGRLIKRSGISDQRLAEIQMIRALKKQLEKASKMTSSTTASQDNTELAAS